MNIALMSHDRKKELMVQFCIAYCGILSKHTICATNTTGRLVAEATGLPVQLFLSHEHGGPERLYRRIAFRHSRDTGRREFQRQHRHCRRGQRLQLGRVH